jgi:glyoxalase family protein
MIRMTQTLEGIHHITAITADAPANVDFYARLLGLRMVKKTVNFDMPDVYHLYYGDESGDPGTILTFFEFPDAASGRHGDGMIHTIQWTVGGEESLDFWEKRLASEGIASSRSPGLLRLADPEGLGVELVVDPARPEGLSAASPDISANLALRGFSGVRAYSAHPEDSDRTLGEDLGFERSGPARYRSYSAAGNPSSFSYDPPPSHRGYQGAGSVHHIAWASKPEDHAGWRVRLEQAELRPTPIIDRQYFFSIYFREPSGILFEIATIGPGFTIDEPLDRLGEALMLPPRYEPIRPQLEVTLTPIRNPRSSSREGGG